MPFITPDNLPTGTFCRQILIPNSPYWIGLVSGALLPFTYASEWSQVTGITPDEAAERWLQMLNEYWNSDCGGDGMPCEGNCPEVLRRFNPDTLQPEISTDGGSTWVLDPQSAVAQLVAQPPPVPAGISATKCDAATNGKEHIEQLIAGCSDNLGTAINVFDLAVAVVEIVLEIAILFISGGTASPLVIALAPAIWGAAHAAFEFGKAAFDAYWTEDERDKILCALYCTIGEDGNFTGSEYNEFIARWKEDATPSVAFNFVLKALQPIGVKGLNNYCAYGAAADADCSDCECFEPCDPHAWDIIDGTDVVYGTDDDGDYVELTSVTDIPNTGAQGILLTTGDADTCCRIMAYDVISGHLGGGLSSLCGTPAYPDSGSLAHTGIPVPPDTANSILFYDLSVFRLRIHFAAPL